MARQCELLGLSRATYYYQAVGESALNVELRRRLDQEYTAHPFYGYRKMLCVLRQEGYAVNKKRVARLMQQMGIQALGPRPNTSRASPANPVYPYLLRGVAITQVNQVWSADITYLPMPKGFLYLFAIIDWYSRYVLAWQLSNTLDTQFCCAGLEQALAGAGRPTIFNTDQGVQFTSCEFTRRLQQADIRIRMDGRGRALDNIFVERLWRTVKYEDVYIKDYQTPRDVASGLGTYFAFYNQQRPHQALGYETPQQVYQSASG